MTESIQPEPGAAAGATENATARRADSDDTSPEPTVRGRADPDVEKTRSITGLIAVVVGDTAIAVAAILGIVFATQGKAGSSDLPQIVAILSSAFTAIGTLTTSYFGIKGIANAAQNIAAPSTGSK